MGVSSEILTDEDVEVEAVEDGEAAAADMRECFAEVRILASEDAEDTGEITDLKETGAMVITMVIHGDLTILMIMDSVAEVGEVEDEEAGRTEEGVAGGGAS